MENSAPEPEAPKKDVLEGLAASGGKYTGTARICTDPSHFALGQPGDVLIARATMPSYNVLLPIVGAVVTDRGGALCHAAIVSREYGLPCVVGTRDATRRIEDGDVVTVDGDTGRVEITQKAMERAS
jgi:pyruvate,water dikinase